MEEGEAFPDAEAFTCLDQKFRAKRQIKSIVIFMHHLEIRFFRPPFSSKQPGDTWSSPVLTGSPCSWHRVVGVEGHCFALLVEELHFFRFLWVSYVIHRIFQGFRDCRDTGHKQAAGAEGKKAAAPAVMLRCQQTPQRTAWSHSSHRGPRPVSDTRWVTPHKVVP